MTQSILRAYGCAPWLAYSLAAVTSVILKLGGVYIFSLGMEGLRKVPA